MYKRALIVGMGVSGQAAAAFLRSQGTEVVGVDRKDGSDLAPIDLGAFDLVVASPGVPPSHPLLAQKQVEVVGEVELACRYLKGRVLAITGTNGKTTVTLMTEHVLRGAGIDARAAGNVGRPLTAELQGNPDVWVLELSSFQLETLQAKVIDAGVILNITPDHLDRYPDMEAYAAAKLKMAECLKPNGVLYIQESAQKRYGGNGRIFGFGKDCDLNHLSIENLLPLEYRSRLSHDVENILACYALCRECGVAPEQMAAGIQSFKKPPHRLEFVCERSGVSFYDDSKGTNIDAVIRAVEAMEGDTILIAGGIDKGSSYRAWAEPFKGKVSKVCAIGQAAEKIASELGGEIPVELFATLDEAVERAAASAREGMNVLLSPGCSSFDMFRDYRHRGEEFKRIVNKLAGEVKI